MVWLVLVRGWCSVLFWCLSLLLAVVFMVIVVLVFSDGAIV